MDGQALYDLVESYTRQAFGQSLTLHRLRDCAMTGLAIEDPVHVRAGTPLLGHKTLVTTEWRSSQTGSVQAARERHRTLVRLRGQREVPAFTD